MGTWQYDFLNPVPPVENSLRRMVGMLTGQLCGWPSERLVEFRNEHGPGDLPDKLITAYADVTDVALFYYVGHGQIYDDNQLCLGLVGSRSEANRRASTSLKFADVRSALQASDAATKIVILDCCFAGLATIPTLGELAGDVLDMASGTGAYTMAASSEYGKAWYEQDSAADRPQTYFTKYMVDLVECGIPGQPAGLRLEPLFKQLHENLGADRRPLPSRRAVDNALQFVFARNAADPSIQRDPEQEVATLTKRLAETEELKAAADAEIRALQAEVERLTVQASHAQTAKQKRELEDTIDKISDLLEDTKAEAVALGGHHGASAVVSARTGPSALGRHRASATPGANKTGLLGGRYELDRVVGRGGMTVVCRARDIRLDRIVAIKTLRNDLARDQIVQAQFRSKAQSAASLNHPSIVAVYDTGEYLSTEMPGPYIVMEYVDGRSVRDLLIEGNRLPPDRVLQIISGVLQALEYSHQAGIVHQGIAPGNVMVTHKGDVKVMDFGIARMITRAQATGTVQYLSPEQARGEQVDSRSDLYSVGSLMYETLTGRPFIGGSPAAIAYQHVRENPIPPSRLDQGIPQWADAIVLKATAKSPNDRYQTAAEMQADIRRAASGMQVAAMAKPPTRAEYYSYAGRTQSVGPQTTTGAGAPSTMLSTYEQLAKKHAKKHAVRIRRRRWRRRLSWLIAALAVFVAVVVAAALILASDAFVPKVTNLPVGSARSELQNYGFQVKINYTAGPHGTTPGVVWNQVPPQGTSEPKGSTVTISVQPRATNSASDAQGGASIGILQGYDAPGNGGCIVTSIAPNSPVSNAGLRPGDTITNIGGLAVTSCSATPISSTPISAAFLEILAQGPPPSSITYTDTSGVSHKTTLIVY